MEIKAVGKYVARSGIEVDLVNKYTTDTIGAFVGFYEDRLGVWNWRGDCLWLEGYMSSLGRFDIVDTIEKTDAEAIDELMKRLERLEEKLIFD